VASSILRSLDYRARSSDVDRNPESDSQILRPAIFTGPGRHSCSETTSPRGPSAGERGHWSGVAIGRAVCRQSPDGERRGGEYGDQGFAGSGGRPCCSNGYGRESLRIDKGYDSDRLSWLPRRSCRFSGNHSIEPLAATIWLRLMSAVPIASS